MHLRILFTLQKEMEELLKGKPEVEPLSTCSSSCFVRNVTNDLSFSEVNESHNSSEAGDASPNAAVTQKRPAIHDAKVMSKYRTKNSVCHL
jgi:hypothetical protein